MALLARAAPALTQPSRRARMCAHRSLLIPQTKAEKLGLRGGKIENARQVLEIDVYAAKVRWRTGQRKCSRSAHLVASVTGAEEAVRGRNGGGTL